MSLSVYVSTADTRKGFPVLDHPEDTTLRWYPPIMQGWNLLINQRSQGEVDRVRVHITPHTVLSEKCCTWPRSYLTHIDRLTSARNCVMLGCSEVWDSGGGSPLPLEIWIPFIFGLIRVIKARLGFGPVESWKPKLCHVGHLEAWGSCLGVWLGYWECKHWTLETL